MKPRGFQVNQEVYFLDFSSARKAEITGIINPQGKFDKYEEGQTYYWLSGYYTAYKAEDLFPTKEALLESISEKLG